MRKYVIALVVIGVIVLLSRIPDTIRAKHIRPIVTTWYAVKTAALQLDMGESFTNSYPDLIIFRFFPTTTRFQARFISVLWQPILGISPPQ